jgi:adenylate cyclase
MLNEYFSTLVKIIQSHKGVVNKFIGDSIFAIFNVPLDDPDHASNAIRAALEIKKTSASKSFAKNRKLNTRIGINTGVVVAGNIGSEDRIEYTVIGDDVNVAARLEQLNKQFNTHILIGENTFELTKNFFSFTELGDFQLKGKEKTIKVFKIKE